MGHEGGGLAEALAGGGNALLVGGESTGAACAAASTVVDPDEALVLSVAAGVPPEDRVAAWSRHVGTAPKRATCIAVGESHRGGGAGAAVACGSEGSVVVDTVPDLSTLGQRVTRQLGDWGHVEGELVVCVDSLSALLATVDVRPAFRFLQLLTRQVGHAGGVAHYHVDPAAVDAETLATLRPLFDVEVTVEAGGEWTVRDP